MAQSSANALHFQRIHSAERIRSLKLPSVFKEAKNDEHDEHVERDQRALENARNKFEAFINCDEGLNAIVSNLSRNLLEAIEKPSIAKAADELLHQAVVGLWSAFEVLVRDELITLLNFKPDVAAQLLSNPSSKKYFELPKFSIEELSEAKFDLSSSMGTLIFGARDFSDLRTIKAAFSAISNDASLFEALNDNDLWGLNQCRHLIVHRRGVVDAKHKALTDCPLEIGERISVKPTDVEKYFCVVVQAATAVLKGVATATQ